MENQPKLNSSKEVIAYLAKQFPLCFTLEGEARPLKIGIFQDVVGKLPEDAGFSKTQLRTALRLYTSSWRYLDGIKLGVERIDLDGNACGALEEQHVEHARTQLEEAKARVQAQRAAKRREANEAAGNVNDARKPRRPAKKSHVTVAGKTPAPTTRKPQAAKPIAAPVSDAPVKRVDIAELKIGQQVRVRAGKNAMDATILEIAKDGVRVQLASGLAMLVRAEHLQY